MVNIVAALVIVILVGSASIYIYKSKKSGKKCIGCPASDGKCTCGCSSEKE